MFSGQHDGDVTLPEVNLDNEELNLLDDDFSDFNDTGIEDIEEENKGLIQKLIWGAWEGVLQYVRVVK